jgi:hypothetical protein
MRSMTLPSASLQREAHAVRVLGQARGLVPDQAGARAERHFLRAQQRARRRVRFGQLVVDLSGSISCGVSPIRPRITALSVAWPTPVSASEPYRCASTPTAASSGPHSSRKRRAATIGPTVCELDGPMPILNRSNTLMSICLSLYIFILLV